MYDDASPTELPLVCPTCLPDLDDRTYVVWWCGSHAPSREGCEDVLASADASSFAASSEAGGEASRLWNDLLMRGRLS